jgi:hypothetical protein
MFIVSDFIEGGKRGFEAMELASKDRFEQQAVKEAEA